ncbi:hypothetical protein FB451DRAFT_1145257 [Mycena latifolia]|nr:hypothetical protein FB451DRAFT_1145257 [Mycena latifolia]
MRPINLALAAALPWAIRAAQIPFQTPATETLDADSIWSDFSAGPDINATGHLIFDTVNSLLQHWPNTRYRNGHNIIPGTVPVGTLLYHGRQNSSIPTVPEWTATDPEHSYPFCGAPAGTESTGCWHLTFVATRPLKVLYFDGSSAANMKDGTLDSQDLVVWGKVDPTRWLDEPGRIRDLCAWGKEFGIDGYVRMEMDFEIMLCDFTAGVELLASEFLTALYMWPRSPPPSSSAPRSALAFPAHFDAPLPLPPAAPSDPLPKNDSRMAALITFEVVRAGSWHNRYPGETRVVLDLTRLVSFYDTALVPSLVAERAGLERWDHRLEGISAADLAAVTARLRAVLTADPSDAGSGVDWATLFRVVVDRYADRLELLDHLLNTTTAANATARAQTIQTQLRVMLTPYILYSARPDPKQARDDDDRWAAPVWRACATRHAAHIHASAALRARLTASERLLLRALDETSREICRVVVRMWVAGVRAGLDPLIPPEAPAVSPAGTMNILPIVAGWRAETHALMAWLDWSVWVKCRPACGVEEMCYLPTWPFFWVRREQTGRNDTDQLTVGNDTEPFWKRPQPRCIRLFEPYSKL